MEAKKARSHSSTIRTHHQENTNHLIIKIFLGFMILINLIILYIVATRIVSIKNIEQTLQAQEIQKVGGIENYNRLQVIYQSSKYQKEQDFIRDQNYKIYIEQDGKTQNTETTPTQPDKELQAVKDQ